MAVASDATRLDIDFMHAQASAQRRRLRRRPQLRIAAHNGRNCFHVFLLVAAVILVGHVDAWKDAAAGLLAAGDAALSENKLEQAIESYNQGIHLLPQRWTDVGFEESLDDVQVLGAEEISVVLSLHTNYATALSYSKGSDERVLSSYRSACLSYRRWMKETEAKSQGNSSSDAPKEIKVIATQSYFFLGMTHQDLASTTQEEEEQQQQLQSAARSYAAATKIDPNHWSSFANMGVILADVGIDHSSGNKAISLELYEEGIMAYQKAIDILTSGGKDDSMGGEGPTDPPENVREVVSELNYRIGLCLVPSLFSPDKDNEDISEKKCALNTGPKSTPTARSCLELAAYQFNTALQFHPHHDGANAALTMVTADAEFGMSTDVKKVQNLFEDYAPTFEHSLVDELGYDGFHRMRRGFDRAMLSEGKSAEKFALVLDAGCGTGLAGEVVSPILTHGINCYRYHLVSTLIFNLFASSET